MYVPLFEQFGCSFGLLVVTGVEAACDEDSVCEIIDVGTTANTNSEIIMQRDSGVENGMESKCCPHFGGTRQTFGMRP